MSINCKPHIILASKSPRRRELLQMLGIQFQTEAPDPEAEPKCLHSAECADAEDYSEGGSQSDADYYAAVSEAAGRGAGISLHLSGRDALKAVLNAVSDTKMSAAAKAESSAVKAYKRLEGQELISIGADTVVVFGKSILGKPESEEEAFAVLKMLSGRWHHVVTGTAAVKKPENTCVSSCAVTAVKFRELSDKEIWDYVNTGNPMDKAGAYGIQELGSLFVEKIDGCYFNVVGLPISVLNSVCTELGFSLMELRSLR